MSKSVSETQIIENLSLISHELQTPISMITSTARLSEMLLDENKLDTNEFKGYLENIIDNCNKLTMLVSNISEVNHISNSHKEFLNLKDFFEAFYETVLPLCIENHTSIKYQYDSLTENIYISPILLERVLLNLVTNAIKYNDKVRKTIKIKVYDKNNNLMISVKDNGIGIEKENIPKLTEQFFRVDKTAAPGVGIGLSLVKKYLESINASLKIRSSIKKGTEIIISIPKSTDDEIFTANELPYVYVPEKSSYKIEFAQLKNPYTAY